MTALSPGLPCRTSWQQESQIEPWQSNVTRGDRRRFGSSVSFSTLRSYGTDDSLKKSQSALNETAVVNTMVQYLFAHCHACAAVCSSALGCCDQLAISIWTGYGVRLLSGEPCDPCQHKVWCWSWERSTMKSGITDWITNSRQRTGRVHPRVCALKRNPP